MTIEIKESYKTAVISISHITKEDSELLAGASFKRDPEVGHNWILENEYGFIIYADCVMHNWKNALRQEGISWPAIENLEKVLAAGYQSIHLDRDGDHIEGLQVWEW